MIYSINYANEKFRRAQRLNTKSAYIHGVNRVIQYKETDLDENFRKKNKKILEQKRGNGYWLWKPYIISKTLEKVQDGVYVAYVDSGATYINSVKHLLNAMNESKTDIMLFQIKSLEKNYSKRDALILMDCDKDDYVLTRQRCATFLVLKKTKRTEKFVMEWLSYAQDERIITDCPNEMGEENYEGFLDHRHDQSILSLLSKKYNIEPFRDAAQFGNDMRYDERVLQRSGYPQVFDSHRNPNISSSWILYHLKFFEKAEAIKANIINKLYEMKKRVFGKKE